MKVKRAILKELAKRYQRGSKREKSLILKEFVSLTGYNRCYSSWLLRHCGRKVILRGKDGQQVVVIGEVRKIKRSRPRIYDEEFRRVLIWIWEILDYICGKRLAASLKWLVPKLVEQGELKVRKKIQEKLMKVSAATIDRLLRPERKKYELKSRARTKPGTLLKHQVPIRTFSEWDEAKPGFLEIDLVGHDGGNSSGEFLYSLNATDVASGWIETEALRNRAQVWTFQALERIKQRLPFPLLGIDSDNDGAFINAHLIRYCQENKLTFTRSRPYQKNDNCYVEQKNYSAVRRLVGYLRYDTEQEQNLLEQIYSLSRLYYNFFLPNMKLVRKERIGSRVTKKHDLPKTPYQRLLESPELSLEQKDRLRQTYQQLNVVKLKREIDRLRERLWRLQKTKKNCTNFRIDSYVRQ
ncbi:MAG: transposase [Candidatus Bathyarchaeota archaeon]|nr:transposase [Candidatus Bathyarchaeota archaeon]